MNKRTLITDDIQDVLIDVERILDMTIVKENDRTYLSFRLIDR